MVWSGGAMNVIVSTTIGVLDGMQIRTNHNQKQALRRLNMVKKETIALPSREKMGREDLLNVSSETIRGLQTRLAVERFREREGDSTKLQYLRVLIAAMQTHNAILRDSELEEMKLRIASLEAACEANR
ncbi:hypothetical protein KDK67_03280 [Methanococcoides seepicolus]|uniref:DUF8136 domain-containing protein n=2 Tax=Methanococcoides seepicolus TaxID=2828780 RepID=A0A9E4ZD81_9EURY|nr:hypothetical protein [Methanococcoides seepicolus]